MNKKEEENSNMSDKDKELESSSSNKEDFFDRIIHLNHKTATKYIVKGFIFAIIFGGLLMTSKLVYSNADEYYNTENQHLRNAFYNSEMGEMEFKQRQNELLELQYAMQAQYLYIGSVARFCVNIAMVFILIGFVGYASDKTMDEKYRQISLIIAGLFLLMVAFTTFFSGVTIYLS